MVSQSPLKLHLSNSEDKSSIRASFSFFFPQEIITTAPRSLAALLEVLLPRLQPRAEVRGVSIQDQQSLVSMCMYTATRNGQATLEIKFEGKDS